MNPSPSERGRPPRFGPRLLNAIHREIRDNGMCLKSNAELAEEVGCTEGHVNRLLRTYEEAEILRREQAEDRNAWNHTRRRIVFVKEPES